MMTFPIRRHALTVDVEDYFQVTAFEHCVARDAWPAMPSRVEANTLRLLKILDRHGARGTFFVLGWIAERFPRLVRAIQDAGHEIASHGYWHERIYRQTPAEFRADVRRSKQVLEDIAGESVTMYRAPTFSITRETLWALDVLFDEGFTVDASIFPIRHDRYGIRFSPTTVHRMAMARGGMWEFPPAVAEIAGRRIPVGGGGYFRMMPWWWTRAMWRRCEQASPLPRCFYLHPWEIDPEQPHVAGARRLSSWRHRLNLASSERKLEALLVEFRFAPMGELLAELTITEQPRAGEIAAPLAVT
jgi:polysaccharide deacetylase family protein (PEP-CTERM system associated)